MQPSDLRVSITNMSSKEKQLAAQCNQLSFTASASTALLNVRDDLGVGIKWIDSQIRYLTKKERQRVSDLSSKASSAERLVEVFDKRNDVNYLYVTYSPQEGLILSMNQKQKAQLKKDIKAQLKNDIPLNMSEKDLLITKKLETIYTSSKMETNGKLLLIFLFASAEERRLVRMFPEYCCCDTLRLAQTMKRRSYSPLPF